MKVIVKAWVNVEKIADRDTYEARSGVRASASDLQVAAERQAAAGKVGMLSVGAPEPEQHQVACCSALR